MTAHAGQLRVEICRDIERQVYLLTRHAKIVEFERRQGLIEPGLPELYHPFDVVSLQACDIEQPLRTIGPETVRYLVRIWGLKRRISSTNCRTTALAGALTSAWGWCWAGSSPQPESR